MVKKNTRKKWHLQKRQRNTCGYRGACISKDDWTKGRGFNESIKTKMKQNKTNVTPEKNVMTSANQTPGGHKFAPLVASQQGREPACFGLSSPWSFPSRSGIPLHAVVQSWFFLQRSILPWNVPPLVLPFCAIPPRPGLQLSTGRRWCRKLWDRPGNTPSTLFSWPPTQPAPLTISPNIAHFGSLVSSMRATNPANKIRLLRKVASMLSLPVLRSVSR